MIAAVGTVDRRASKGRGAQLRIACHLPGEPLSAGESVAVNGACLTVTDPGVDGFSADVSPETLERTTLGRLGPGRSVNLERALRVGDRLGGHLVLGHVDATVSALAVRPEQGFSRVRFSLPEELAAEVADKGSVAVDGVSLTVAATSPGWFEVALVPTTLADTTLAAIAPGDTVNLETDVLAKYVRRALGGDARSGDARLWELLGAQD